MCRRAQIGIIVKILEMLLIVQGMSHWIANLDLIQLFIRCDRPDNILHGDGAESPL